MMPRRARRALAAQLRHRDPLTLRTIATVEEGLRRLDDIEYLDELEQDNTRLTRDIQQADNIIIPKLAELPDLRDESARLRAYRARVEHLEAIRVDIERLPENLPDTIDLIERLYPDRLIFTPAAVESARQAKINGWHGCPHVAWRLLRGMAIPLLDLYRGNDPTNIPRDFQARTGFELAATEGSETKKNRALLRARLAEHDDGVIQANAHAKYGNSYPRLLRVYYGFCPDCACLVIGHCGDHLPTAGSRRRK